MVLVATGLAVLQEGLEEFLQDQVELSGSRLAGWGHGLQARSELIHGDRDLAGETTGARGLFGPMRPINVCSVYAFVERGGKAAAHGGDGAAAEQGMVHDLQA